MCLLFRSDPSKKILQVGCFPPWQGSRRGAGVAAVVTVLVVAPTELDAEVGLGEGVENGLVLGLLPHLISLGSVTTQ